MGKRANVILLYCWSFCLSFHTTFRPSLFCRSMLLLFSSCARVLVLVQFVFSVLFRPIISVIPFRFVLNFSSKFIVSKSLNPPSHRCIEFSFQENPRKNRGVCKEVISPQLTLSLYYNLNYQNQRLYYQPKLQRICHWSIRIQIQTSNK